MSRDEAKIIDAYFHPKDNGWRLKAKCESCNWIGEKFSVCPSCGQYFSHTCVKYVSVRWVRTTKWYHWFTTDCPRGYWEEKDELTSQFTKDYFAKSMTVHGF